MKKNTFLLFISVLTLFLSCKDDDTRFETRIIANAVLESKDVVRASVAVETERPINESGKIYTYTNYVFVNDRNLGVHVIDNRIPENPQKIAFLKIPGNFDIEVRNDILYADSYTDLVLFNIADIDNITLIDRYEDVFNDFGFSLAAITESFDQIDYGNYNPSESFVVGWTYSEIQVEIQDFGDDIFLEDAAVTSGDVTGQGGSFARFKIVDSYLYVVDFSDLYVFDISTLGVSSLVGQQGIGWQIETIFNRDDYLYIGSQNGMLIYNIEDRTQPQYASEINHLQGCDPVVVDGDYAYLTLRGGNTCGQQLSILEVINIADKNNPYSVREYSMQEPYGLGIKEDLLFVSDGPNGFHIYDKSSPEELVLLEVIEDINVFDVIPLEDKLLAIANNTLYQYTYEENGLSLLSEYVIN
ncbi:LVIVD repeat-containing protein [Dokdonia ponticola]|uniref:LVIVD repeat-containing protein n=1 Tax=Dokdonia ponticola TaxID=2041041 RepID=A0ABV9HYD8_9FLAO